MSYIFDFSKKNAELAANEIVDRLCSTISHSNTELDYEIKQGTMVQTGSPNLFFKFNVDEKENVLKSYLNFFEKTDKEEIYKEEIEWNKKVRDFILQRIDDVRNAIRKNLLQNVMKELVPLKSIEVKNLDMTPSRDCGFMIVIQKVVKNDSSYDQSVREDIFNTYTETGMAVEDIVKMRKEQNDHRYTNIVSATKKEYISEIELSLLVDFSFTPKEEFEIFMRSQWKSNK